MPTYSTPGVYIQEVSGGTRPIQGVGTETAAFLGVPPLRGAHLDKVVAINNREHFRAQFCGDATEATPLAHAVFGFFLNGGQRCYVVNVGEGGSLSGGSGNKKRGLDLLEAIDEVAIVAAPGYTDYASYDAVLSHCERMEDRVAVLDAPEDVDDIDRLKESGSAPAPPPRRPRREGAEEGAEAPASPPAAGLRCRDSPRGFGALYFPWITVADPLSPSRLVNCPPSGHMAGIYARVDSQRGVHKAPANEVINGALNLTYRLTNAEQGGLNDRGINCLRFFQREGFRVWGARTLADAASEWRYLNVRRLFNMVEESIAKGTRWVVFEPNDRSLWKSIERDVRAFLLQLWRDGALMGATPDQAFFVLCNEETNPPESIDQGRVVVRVGLAPVKPAEFVIFQIGQTAAGSQIESEGG